MRKPDHGGGWQAIRYTWRKGREVGLLPLWRAMRSKNACKTCALGMGGQLGGMVNEAGHFPEVCKKSLQAMAADMRGRIEPRFFETYSLDQLKMLSPRELEYCGRLTTPLIAGPGDTHYRVVSWDAALGHAAARLKATPPERAFFYASGRSSNEAGFLLHLLGRSYGTNHVSNCSFYCHQASGVGLHESIGTGTATVALEDLEKCDLVFLIGGNPASNHPRLMTSLMKLRERGGQVVVINPLRETGLVNFKVPSSVKSMLLGSPIASVYVQPTIGGDIALMAGIAKRLIETGRVDQAFIDANTEGYEGLRTYVAALAWTDVEAASGVSRPVIEEAADIYATSERAIFSWTMGITHHEHGVENLQWIVNLALLRGMVGKEGAGLMPIRGHSNVQGMGSIGVTPAMSKAAVERLESIGLSAPAFAGYDTLAALEAANRGEMEFALCLGGNLYGASPHALFTSAALGGIDTVVYLSTALNTGHAHGLGRTTVILPVAARDEEPQATTQESMFNFVRVSDGGKARHEGPRTEVDILTDIALGALGEGGPLDWNELKSHDEIRRLIGKLVPNLEQIQQAGLEKKEFEIPGRLLHRPAFNTASGRAAFKPHPMPFAAPLAQSQLRLMTIRSEGQFNTVVYETEDIYRGQERRDVVLMNAGDIARLGLTTDQPVDVVSDAGVMRSILVRPFDIAQGCAAMYYPEANVLVPRSADRRSKTPAFKSVLVTVTPSKRTAPERLADEPIARHSDLKAC